MNTTFCVPFLFISLFVITAMLLLPFWFKARIPEYLKKYKAQNLYAVMVAIFGMILSLVTLCGWLVSALNLLQTTPEFDPDGKLLHSLSFSLYGQLYALRWSSATAVLLLLGTSLYFWFNGKAAGK